MRHINPKEVETLLSILQARNRHHRLMMDAYESGDIFKFKKLQDSFLNVKKHHHEHDHGHAERCGHQETTNSGSEDQNEEEYHVHDVNGKTFKHYGKDHREGGQEAQEEQEAHIISKEGKLEENKTAEVLVDQLTQNKNDEFALSNQVFHQQSLTPAEQVKKQPKFFSNIMTPDNTASLGFAPDTPSVEAVIQKPKIELKRPTSNESKRSHKHLFINDAFSETNFHPVDHDQLHQLVDFLKNYSFFESRTRNDIFDIAICLLLEKFDKGQIVFDQDDYGDKFFVILQGSVSVEIRSRQVVDPEELELRKGRFEHEKNQLITHIQRMSELEIEFIQLKDEKEKLILEKIKVETLKLQKNTSKWQQQRNEGNDLQIDKQRVKTQESPVKFDRVNKSQDLLLNNNNDIHLVRQSFRDIVIEENTFEDENDQVQSQPQIKVQTATFDGFKSSDKRTSVIDSGVQSRFSHKSLKDSEIGTSGAHTPRKKEVFNDILQQSGMPMKVLDAYDQQHQQQMNIQILQNLKNIASDDQSKEDNVHHKLLKKFLSKRAKQGMTIQLKDSSEETQQYAKKMSMASSGNAMTKSMRVSVGSFNSGGNSSTIKKSNREIELVEEISQVEYQIVQCQKFISSVVLTENETIWKNVATLKQGQSFGELAIISDKNGLRAARIVSQENSYMGVITREDYKKCLMKIEKKKWDKMLDQLSQMPYFKKLTERDLMRLFQCMNLQKFVRNQTVLKEGEVQKPKKLGDGRQGSLSPKGANNSTKILNSNDDVYFILSGEFVAIQEIHVENDCEDKQISESKNNKTFLNIKEESCMKMEHLKNLSEEQQAARSFHIRSNKKVVTNPNESQGLKKSIRANLQNKMVQVTNIKKLTKKKIVKQEIELTKLGPGSVFGETCHIISEFKAYQPYTVKCVSTHSEVLRVSGHEFVKKFLTNDFMLKTLKDSAIENLYKQRIKKIQRFYTIRNFQEYCAQNSRMMSYEKENDMVNDNSRSPIKSENLSKEESQERFPKNNQGKSRNHQDIGSQNLSSKNHKSGKIEKTIEFSVNMGLEQSSVGQPSVVSKQSFDKSKSQFKNRYSSPSQDQEREYQQSQIQSIKQDFEGKEIKSSQSFLNSNKLSLKQKVIAKSIDKRDAMKEIVCGYQEYKKMACIEEDQVNYEHLSLTAPQSNNQSVKTKHHKQNTQEIDWKSTSEMKKKNKQQKQQNNQNQKTNVANQTLKKGAQSSRGDKNARIYVSSRVIQAYEQHEQTIERKISRIEKLNLLEIKSYNSEKENGNSNSNSFRQTKLTIKDSSQQQRQGNQLFQSTMKSANEIDFMARNEFSISPYQGGHFQTNMDAQFLMYQQKNKKSIKIDQKDESPVQAVRLHNVHQSKSHMSKTKRELIQSQDLASDLLNKIQQKNESFSPIKNGKINNGASTNIIVSPKSLHGIDSLDFKRQKRVISLMKSRHSATKPMPEEVRPPIRKDYQGWNVDQFYHHRKEMQNPSQLYNHRGRQNKFQKASTALQNNPIYNKVLTSMEIPQNIITQIVVSSKTQHNPLHFQKTPHQSNHNSGIYQSHAFSGNYGMTPVSTVQNFQNEHQSHLSQLDFDQNQHRQHNAINLFESRISSQKSVNGQGSIDEMQEENYVQQRGKSQDGQWAFKKNVHVQDNNTWRGGNDGLQKGTEGAMNQSRMLVENQQKNILTLDQIDDENLIQKQNSIMHSNVQSSLSTGKGGMKTHGWFTGHMQGVPLKFTNQYKRMSKNRSKVSLRASHNISSLSKVSEKNKLQGNKINYQTNQVTLDCYNKSIEQPQIGARNAATIQGSSTAEGGTRATMSATQENYQVSAHIKSLKMDETSKDYAQQNTGVVDKNHCISQDLESDQQQLLFNSRISGGQTISTQSKLAHMQSKRMFTQQKSRVQPHGQSNAPFMQRTAFEGDFEMNSPAKFQNHQGVRISHLMTSKMNPLSHSSNPNSNQMNKTVTFKRNRNGYSLMPVATLFSSKSKRR